MILNMLFYLTNKEVGKFSFLFEFGYIIFRGVGGGGGGGVNHPFRWTFSRLIYHIYKFLYCLTVVCHCIHVMFKLKGKYAE